MDEYTLLGEARVKRKIPRGLKHNISLPVTGEEAMKRLLACKGKDPYSILGVFILFIFCMFVFIFYCMPICMEI